MKLLIDTIRNYIPLSAADEKIIHRLFHKKVIEKGLVRYYIDKDGEFVCDYMSFLPQAPARINIQALEDTVVWVINHSDLQQFYKEVHHGERFGRLAIEESPGLFICSLPAVPIQLLTHSFPIGPGWQGVIGDPLIPSAQWRGYFWNTIISIFAKAISPSKRHL